MNPRFPVLFFILLLVLGCSKDNNAIPNLTLNDYTSTVSPGESFTATLGYSQSGGSLSQDSLVVWRKWYNLNLPPGVDVSDTFLTFLQETPSADKATIKVSLLYENLFVDFGENDTMDFSFVLIDYNGKHSDTVKTGKVVLLK